MDEDDTSPFQCKAQLGCGGTMEIVTTVFVIFNGAARDPRALGKVLLRPIQKAACRATQRWC
ncbi:hypothetical protein RvVAR031_39370 [Agrobacterium vitis]|nr:hypothetical protein RvVAR031_39370 [Agrobacterium vitis]